MLAEFRVQNIACLRDEQTLRLVPTSDRSLAGNVLATGCTGLPGVLCSALLYGANGSGKTTLFRALQLVRTLLLTGAEVSRVRPFLAKEASHSAPSSFELVFLVGEWRYRYAFSCRDGQVVAERLLVYETRRPSLLFERSFEEATGRETWTFGTHLPGAKKAARQRTGRSVLFLAELLGTNRFLAPVKDWLVRQHFVFEEDVLRVLTDEALLWKKASEAGQTGNGAPGDRAELCSPWGRLAREDGFRDKVLALVQKLQPGSVGMVCLPDDQGRPQLSFRHATGSMRTWQEESLGLRRLILLGAVLCQAREAGGLVLVDALQGLHPLLLRRLLALLHEGANGSGHPVQLLATTHETSLLQTVGSLFRRDQIWFMEKTQEESSELYSLAGFGPRKGEAVERGYLQGRYGALP